MSASNILRTVGLTKSFGTGAALVRAVDDVNLEVTKGEIVLIMGPSGSGKTTLLSMMGGLLRPTSGSLFLRDLDLAQTAESELPKVRTEHIGFIFQAFNLLDALPVEENILLPAQLAPGGVKAARQRANELIERLGLANRRSAYPRTLSGGEKQRCAIARALINRPPLILADEPTGNLDSQKGQEVMMILHDIARDDDCAVVIVTHDPRIEQVADRVLWLEDGKIRDRKSETHSWVRDPVCGMRVDAWTSPHFEQYENQRLVFCSQRCRERFVTNPRAYAKPTTSEEAAQLT